MLVVPTAQQRNSAPPTAVGFDLASDVTLEQANEIAAYMRKLIRSISYTKEKGEKKK